MPNVLVIGDSHTTRMGYVSENWFRENVSSEKIVTGNSHFDSQLKDENNYKIFMKDVLISYEDDNSKMLFSGHSGRSAYSYDFVNFASGTQKDILEKWNVEGNVFIPWLGYIDCRNHLPRKNLPNYADAKKVVSTYIKNVMDSFDKCDVVFMEPVPQFITIVTSDWRFPHLDPAIEFEERHEEYLEFIKELRIQCAENGLSQPINVSEILGTNMIESWMQPKKPIKMYLNDHMSPEHYEKILSHIYNMFK
jgi:hypothetical protein